MALTPCDACACISGVYNRDAIQQNVQIILCGILEAISTIAPGGGFNLAEINGVSPVAVGNGASNTGTLRVTVANDSTGQTAPVGHATAGNSPVRFEDAAFAAGEAVMVAGAQRQDTPANNTGSDGDIAPLKGNTVGALYIEPANQVAVFAYANYPEASITNAFTTALSNSAKLKFLKFTNTTNAALEVSFNATDVHLYLQAGEIVYIDLGANGRWMASDVSVRYVSNPTSGALIVSGYS